MSKYDSLLKGDKEPEPPRPSCIERLHIRRQLTAIIPGQSKVVNGVYVRRTTVWREYTYWLADVEMTLEETVDVALGRIAAPAPMAEIFQFDLCIETDEARPRRLHPRKPSKPKAPKAKPKKKRLKDLPLFALLAVADAA
jgi:hypothetical protein